MTAGDALAEKVRLLLKVIDRGEQKLLPIRGETEGAPPTDLTAELRKALHDYEQENS